MNGGSATLSSLYKSHGGYRSLQPLVFEMHMQTLSLFCSSSLSLSPSLPILDPSLAADRKQIQMRRYLGASADTEQRKRGMCVRLPLANRSSPFSKPCRTTAARCNPPSRTVSPRQHRGSFCCLALEKRHPSLRPPPSSCPRRGRRCLHEVRRSVRRRCCCRLGCCRLHAKMRSRILARWSARRS